MPLWPLSETFPQHRCYSSVVSCDASDTTLVVSRSSFCSNVTQILIVIPQKCSATQSTSFLFLSYYATLLLSCSEGCWMRRIETIGATNGS